MSGRLWQSDAPNALLARGEEVVKAATGMGHAVFILRIGNSIQIRDNSGIEGLCDQKLFEQIRDLLNVLYPPQSPAPTTQRDGGGL
jgi:hypothetical protein